MATYLIMGKFTQQGNKNIKQTTSRANRFREIAGAYGVTVKDIFWLTGGEYDVVNIVEADNEKLVSSLMLELGAWGNVSTTTFRAYSQDEMIEILTDVRDYP